MVAHGVSKTSPHVVADDAHLQWLTVIEPLIVGRRVLLCGAREDPPDFDRSLIRRVQDAGPVEIVANDLKPLSSGSVRTIVGNAEEATLGGPYDVVLALKVFNHLGNPRRFLENARAALAPGGTLVIKTPNAGSIQLLLMRLCGRVAQSDYANPLHVVWHDRSSLGGLVAQSGYTVSDEYFIQSRRTWKQRLLWWCVKLKPEYAEDLLVICRVGRDAR